MRLYIQDKVCKVLIQKPNVDKKENWCLLNL